MCADVYAGRRGGGLSENNFGACSAHRSGKQEILLHTVRIDVYDALVYDFLPAPHSNMIPSRAIVFKVTKTGSPSVCLFILENLKLNEFF